MLSSLEDEAIKGWANSAAWPLHLHQKQHSTADDVLSRVEKQLVYSEAEMQAHRNLQRCLQVAFKPTSFAPLFGGAHFQLRIGLP